MNRGASVSVCRPVPVDDDDDKENRREEVGEVEEGVEGEEGEEERNWAGYVVWSAAMWWCAIKLYRM